MANYTTVRVSLSEVHVHIHVAGLSTVQPHVNEINTDLEISRHNRLHVSLCTFD